MPSDPVARSSGLGETVGTPGESVAATTSRAVSRSYAQAEAATGEVAAFIRSQPVAAVLIALGLGYVLGRLRI